MAEEPVEDYLITVWPEEPSPAVITRAHDRCGHNLRASASPPKAEPVQPTPEETASADAEHDRLAALRNKLLEAAGPTDPPANPQLGQTPGSPQEPASPPADWQPRHH
ncbi:hypothetical protein [Kitasatospora sp. NPDC059827]|uniref:hypothetical protein n=1 Tax=Kitasatospora sp. NPDC059827 TaxID=3346964 RepID=UPI003648735D